MEFKIYSEEYNQNSVKLIGYCQELLQEYNDRAMADQKWLVNAMYTLY